MQLPPKLTSGIEPNNQKVMCIMSPVTCKQPNTTASTGRFCHTSNHPIHSPYPWAAVLFEAVRVPKSPHINATSAVLHNTNPMSREKETNRSAKVTSSEIVIPLINLQRRMLCIKCLITHKPILRIPRSCSHEYSQQQTPHPSDVFRFSSISQAFDYSCHPFRYSSKFKWEALDATLLIYVRVTHYCYCKKDVINNKTFHIIGSMQKTFSA